MRDAKQIVEMFCIAYGDASNKIQKFIKTEDDSQVNSTKGNLE